jgi:hypothetical protein
MEALLGGTFFDPSEMDKAIGSRTQSTKSMNQIPRIHEKN